MRFIVMHKVDEKMEAGARPDQKIVQEMGKLIQESLKSGVFKNGAGLHRSATRARVTYEEGRRTVKKGPYAGQNELVASMFLVRTAGMDQALAQADRVAGALGDGEIEIGPVVEPWDIGVIPKPADPPPPCFLLLCKGDARTETGAPDPQRRAAVDALAKTMTDEGVLLASERLAPSARGMRLASGAKEKRTWVDGPFTESKELIAGFSILELPTLADVLAWADRYAAILSNCEVDVRELETD
jgi:hypothetical protein